MSNNARKVFHYAIEIDGVDQLLIQDVKRPEKEIGAVKHGAANGKDKKTAGGQTVSDAILQKIKPAPGSDKWAMDWMKKAEKGLAEGYKKDVVFKELDPNGKTLDAEIWEGCWIRKSSHSNYKRGAQDENVIETVTISVDDVNPLQ